MLNTKKTDQVLVLTPLTIQTIYLYTITGQALILAVQSKFN